MDERGTPSEEPVRFVTKRSGRAEPLSEEVFSRQPGRIRRQARRLSGVFLRRPGPMALTAALRSSRSVQARKGSMFPADVLPEDDPAELSNQITAPGILKIFGNEICEGAHYKSVLATTHSSARELVKEALDRYGLSKQEADAYVLCDTIGSIHSRQWRTEAFRVVGDHEKPLVLQSLWKPRDGLARRFEIQKRSSVEERTSRETDTVTAGLNAQARKLQKSRSRVSSTLLERGAGSKLWRSKSEMDLLDTDSKPDPGFIKQNLEPSPQQNPAAPQEAPGSAGEGEESEREETESSGDNTSQYSLHPPHDCPYLLLLQGRCSAQDFLVYLLAAPLVGVGRDATADRSKDDISLHAADILPQHCHFLHRRPGEPVVLRPSADALVTRNGEVLRGGVALSPGDVIGLGRHYLFLFKDPSALQQDAEAPDLRWSSWGSSSSAAMRSSQTFVSSSCISDLQPPAGAAEAFGLTLSYEDEDEERLVREIVAMPGGGGAPLGASFLLSLCLRRSAWRRRASDLRRLLLLTASNCQSAVWEHTKNAAAARPDVRGDEVFTPEELHSLRLNEVVSGLRPLVLWMSNSLELLNFIQHQLPLLLEWRSRTAPGREEDGEEDIREAEDFELLELRLSCLRSVSEETVSALEEVLLLCFQQCVFYITKFLYPVLPALLDCNPFSGGPGGLQVPAAVQQVLLVLTRTWKLLSDCRVHPEISSQLMGYMFYFISASLFNSFMERGSEPGFYRWSRGVRMRANLDLLLDWAHAAGVGEPALENTQVLSSAINLLATPPKKLLQSSWAWLRSEFPSLTAAQLNHLLSRYSPAPPCRQAWTPSPQDRQAARQTSDILQSFDSHHPLLLPDEGYQLQLTAAGTEPALMEELDRLREFISGLSAPQGEDVQTLQTCSRSSEERLPSQTFIQNSSPSISASPSSHPFSSSDGEHSPTQKLKDVEQEAGRTSGATDVDPPGPHEQDGPLHEDGRGFESPSALKADVCRLKRHLELKEEEEDEDEEVFSLELERAEEGLGLALVDSRDEPLTRVGGVFIHAVLPESPAAQCEQQEPGDRILAVNGVSLMELDRLSGRELIQPSGATLRLLVGRPSCEGPAVQTGF
uniref:Si:ch211-176g6.2 n=1 Tax=Oryzias melastigma TaxID=30732 RepID=A0A3B3CAF0_ORYME